MNGALKKDLLNILAREKELYQRLFSIAETKKQALIDNDLNQIVKTVESDREVIKEIEAAEAERKAKIELIKTEFELELSKDSYSELIAHLPADWKNDLEPLRADLVELTDQFQQLNHQNELLLKQALELNKLSFETIMQKIKDQDSTYSQQNKSKKEQPRIINRQG